MAERHIALVVEDDKETAEDLCQILRATDCEGVVVDNAEDAVNALHEYSICLVLLDLQIKSARGELKGHPENGRSVLRKIRERHTEHYRSTYWLPVLVVSGFARERDEAVDIMKSGASDVIQKPLDSRQVSEAIRRVLQESGRQTHEQCHEPPRTPELNLRDGVVIAIPGDRIGRRTRIVIAGHIIDLPNFTLKILLHLMVAQQKGELVNKRDMGATDEQGFKGVSVLRHELKPVLGNTDIVKNHYHGNYSLAPGVTIGEFAVDKLLDIGDKTVSDLAAQLRQAAPPRPRKSEGNSEEFPTHHRRRKK